MKNVHTALLHARNENIVIYFRGGDHCQCLVERQTSGWTNTVTSSRFWSFVSIFDTWKLGDGKFLHLWFWHDWFFFLTPPDRSKTYGVPKAWGGHLPYSEIPHRYFSCMNICLIPCWISVWLTIPSENWQTCMLCDVCNDFQVEAAGSCPTCVSSTNNWSQSPWWPKLVKITVHITV